MDNLLRLLLRFILVPLGYLAAAIVGTLVILFGAWRPGLPPALPIGRSRAGAPGSGSRCFAGRSRPRRRRCRRYPEAANEPRAQRHGNRKSAMLRQTGLDMTEQSVKAAHALLCRLV